MRHLRKAGQGSTADTLGWRIGGDALGILRFELLKPSEQPVVFNVGNFRRIEGVIQKVVVADLTTQVSQRLQVLLWDQALLWERALPANLSLPDTLLLTLL
jgi:hypothetical protein